jgi:N-acetylmuramoyl-L-alanine amidase
MINSGPWGRSKSRKPARIPDPEVKRLKVKRSFFPNRWIVFLAILLAPGFLAAKSRIVLDAAHGGNDPGVKAGSEVEKDWNLKFAQALQKALEEQGFEVVQIRKGDSAIAPEKRAELANTTQASAVIILHADREWTKTQRGPYVVLEPPSRGEVMENGEVQKWGSVTLAQYRSSLRLARSIAQKLGLGTDFSTLSDSRGLAGEVSSPDGRIFCLPHESLRYLTLPAIVLTPLFLTSSSDLKKFSRAESLSEFAQGVSKGISEFLQTTP